ncbi:MAG: MEDS domain-containing protein [Desulfuromonadaceae bacterium]|nr:MEDS domain-containing protein [Desulfuromonadaceae bacterium]
MNDQKEEIGRGFAEAIPECHHLCLIYDSEEQRRKIVSEYLATGLKQGELVRYFTDTTSAQELRAWILDTGIDLPKAEENGAFAILKAESSYCPSGRFVPQEVIKKMVSRYAAARDAGYHGSRACGEMSWTLRDIPGAENFLEYEVRINMITETFPYIGMCQYDSRLFDGATLFNVLQVHPFMIAQGQIVRNPFYLKPEEFLAKLEASRKNHA